MRQRRRFCRVVIAGEREHAAMARRPGGIRVLENIAAAIDARPLAVPHRVHAVVACLREEIELLRAPDRSRGEVFVHARLEADVVLLEMLARAPEALVEAAKR